MDRLAGKLMELIIRLRNEARAGKNFTLADSIRKGLADINVADLKTGRTGRIGGKADPPAHAYSWDRSRAPDYRVRRVGLEADSPRSR